MNDFHWGRYTRLHALRRARPDGELRVAANRFAIKLAAVTVIFVVALSTVQAARAESQSLVPDGRLHQFRMHDKQFWIDDQPIVLLAGEMHFGRVLADDWELRIKQAKAMGLNTVSFYLFWNLVEPREGKFDFTGMNDVRRVIKLCQDNGLWVILRPGPYCCAEVDYGGLPSWTLKYPSVKIRTADAKYLEWCRRYIGEVYKQIADLQVTRGGPLLMVQLDNEYGIVAHGNNDYIVALRKIFNEVGFDVPLFTCDPGFTEEWTDAKMRLPDLLIGRNGLKNDRDAAATATANGDLPIYAPEIYTGWFSGWGEKIQRRQPLPKQMEWVNYLLAHHDSFCLYMFFGGTNWGYNTGCNEFLPVQTSYDYDAPIDEAGRTTEKFRALREAYAKYRQIELPTIPPEPAVMALPTIKFTEREPLVEWLPDKPTLVSEQPVSMEALDQPFGFVLYRKKFTEGLHGKLQLHEARDYTIVMVNGTTIGKAFVGYGPESSVIQIDEAGPVTLDLLVHNLGRISVPVDFHAAEQARKGLIGGAELDGRELTGWDIYSLPLSWVDHFKVSDSPHRGPTFYRAKFNVDELASTFLDMRNWSFGVVWVNGHNLGRYWDRGGLRSLFLPRQFLKSGENEIVVLELHDAPNVAEVDGSMKIVEAPPMAFEYRLDKADLPAVGARPNAK
ncbi:MAG TPA: beta-galactosidase [Pirellulales bacterium]